MSSKEKEGINWWSNSVMNINSIFSSLNLQFCTTGINDIAEVSFCHFPLHNTLNLTPWISPTVMGGVTSE